MAHVMPDPARLFAPPSVELRWRADGTAILRSPVPLGQYPPCVGEYLEHWGRVAPERPFLLERAPDGSWTGSTFGEALAQVRRLAAGLLRRRLSAGRPVAILSDNSVRHGLLTLAALHAGIPVVPISPAYSLVSRDFRKLRTIITLIEPGLVFVEDEARYAGALAAIQGHHNAVVVVGGEAGSGGGRTSFSDLMAVADESLVEPAFRAVGPDTVAKLLFTSGSTGEPKGVINTQRMLSASQQARTQVWPFLSRQPPVIVDWLPWSHTFGGNHNFNMVLRHGGTLHIDGGRPTPNLFDQTVANLRDIAPTVYFNVPRGYDMLVPALRADEMLRRNFTSRLQIIFYAAAALPQNLWEDLADVVLSTLGHAVPMVSAWGSTETAPLAADCHFQADRSGVIGLPVPGCDLKLVPSGQKLEVRVRGPNVTPGYWRRPDLTASQFDEEGFYRIGDAVRLVNPEHPEQGLLFDGRVSEDFKLDTGTWVNVGMLRVKAIAALAPVAQDIVLTGHDRKEIGLLIFPNLVSCRQLVADLPSDASLKQVIGHPTLRSLVSAGLLTLKRESEGSSTHATRALVMEEPPSIDAGEITDKGYINQRAVLDRRAALVEFLYQQSNPEVIEPGGR